MKISHYSAVGHLEGLHQSTLEIVSSEEGERNQSFFSLGPKHYWPMVI